MEDNTTESRYYCAGRYCTAREKCHRHTSSTRVNNAAFDDYDLVYMRAGWDAPCTYFVDRDTASII